MVDLRSHLDILILLFGSSAFANSSLYTGTLPCFFLPGYDISILHRSATGVINSKAYFK
jgi:hypothetical protein